MSWPITAMSVSCALGDGVDAVAAALMAGRHGLVPLGADDGLPFTTWYGRLAVEPGDHPLARSRQDRLALHLLSGLGTALDDARSRWGPTRIGVALGTTTGGIGDTERHHAAWTARADWPGSRDTATWLTEVHNLHTTADVVARAAGVCGPRLVQSSACASSAKVLGTAARWLAQGRADAVIVGGADTFCRYTLLGFHSLGILSSSPCRPFAAGRDGINLGEGGAFFLLERRADAIVGRLLGVGETSDAYHLTQPRPDGAGLADAIADALRRAGLPATAVDVVNAHATATPANDLAETAALQSSLPHRPWVAGTKSATGHTLGAAGAVEAAITLLGLQRGFVPGTLTELPLEPDAERLALSLTPQRWPQAVGLSTSAAFAGHNAAVLLGVR